MKKLRVLLPSVEGVRYGLFNENGHVTRTSGEERNMWSGVSDQWRKASFNEHCFTESLLGWSEGFSCCWATLLRSVSCVFYFVGNYSVDDSDGGKNEVLGEKPAITLPSTNSKLTSMGSSASLRGEKPVTLTTPFQLQVVVVTSHIAPTEALWIFAMCVCMYVRIHVYMWYRILQILSFALYMSNRRHCRSVSHLFISHLFPSFVAYESLKVSCSILYTVHAVCFVRTRKFKTEIRIRC
jgi:hypothetical protein